MPSRSENRSKGRRLPVTKTWAAAVRDEMKRRGLSLRKLGAELGVHHSTLGVTVNADVSTSPLVDAISAHLGVPYDKPMDEDEAELLRLARRIARDDPAAFRRYMRQFEDHARDLDDDDE